MTKIIITYCIIAAVCLIDGLIARQTERSRTNPYTNTSMRNNFQEIFYNMHKCIINSTENENFMNTMQNIKENSCNILYCIRDFPNNFIPSCFSIMSNMSSQGIPMMNAMQNIIETISNITKCLEIEIKKLYKKLYEIVEQNFQSMCT
ncbi:PREDICTED: uncharacterized protein LOC108752196 [Trachymyrmex septentrionalis]|uniref:uncharacterized protein LOC108752196 n=1 Tax=Trachymyrmex septentrionalis TaxID=34720 RepID=UPI00084ED956|nr:PREDICTED: uncharacterized protein LOC108752196 [Trachymyrmex septentrionalis]